MSWSYSLKAEFGEALRDRYRSYKKLQMFLAESIEISLPEIAGEGNLVKVCFEALETLDESDRLDALYQAFRSENPNKPFSQRPDLPPAPSPNTNKAHTSSSPKESPPMTSPSKFDFSGANFNGPVSFGDGATGDFIGTQNNYYDRDRSPALTQALEELQHFLGELAQKHPNIHTETEALEIIEGEIIDDSPARGGKLTTLRKQLLNPERHLQASKATVIETAKHFLEQNLLAKAVITYINKFSETPNQGA